MVSVHVDHPSLDIAPPPPFDRVAKRQMLAIMVDLSSATLVGNPVPVVKTMRDRMVHPQPGDLIYEQSTAYWLLYRDPDLTASKWDGQFITYVRTDKVREPIEDEPGEFVTETYLVCLQPDGTEFKWTNADLRAVPDGSPRPW